MGLSLNSPSKEDPKNLDWEGEFRNGNGGPNPSRIYCRITEVSVVSTFTVAEGEILWVGRGRGDSLFSRCGVLDDEKFWKYVVARMSLWMHSVPLIFYLEMLILGYF